MSDTIRCPDCGHENPAGSTACARCNYPLGAVAGPAAPSLAAGGDPAMPPVPAEPVEPVEPVEPAEPPAPAAAGAPIHIPRPVRRARARPAANSTSMSLWLLFAVFVCGLLVYYGVTGFWKSNAPAIEGTSQQQQRDADALRARLAQDSTDIEARVRLGDIYYDTANWNDAIIQYRAAVRMDSSQVNALVDLGVAYYNLSLPDDAERHFLLALRRDPHHPFALFNLGIVSERREDWTGALAYYHRAAQSSPPEAMQQALQTAMQRVHEKSGRPAPPLPGGQ